MMVICEASTQFQSHIQKHHLCLSLIFKGIDSISISKASTKSQSRFQNHQYSLGVIFICIHRFILIFKSHNTFSL